MTESELLAAVIDLAKVYGWRVAHFRPALTARGWRTAVSGDGKGFPDLVLVRERVIVAELKSDDGRVTPEQRVWLNAFEGAGISAYIWRPADLQLLPDLLKAKSSDRAAQDASELRADALGGPDGRPAGKVGALPAVDGHGADAHAGGELLLRHPSLLAEGLHVADGTTPQRELDMLGFKEWDRAAGTAGPVARHLIGGD